GERARRGHRTRPALHDLLTSRIAPIRVLLRGTLPKTQLPQTTECGPRRPDRGSRGPLPVRGGRRHRAGRDWAAGTGGAVRTRGRPGTGRGPVTGADHGALSRGGTGYRTGGYAFASSSRNCAENQ